jgi:hypothetical protein
MVAAAAVTLTRHAPATYSPGYAKAPTAVLDGPALKVLVSVREMPASSRHFLFGAQQAMMGGGCPPRGQE